MLLSLLLSCSTAPEPPAPPPDIVVVVIDTLRADHLSLYGHRRTTSQFMDDLGRSGTWFHRSYASSGWTLPSMATLMSGLHPHQHLVGRLAFRGTEFGKLNSDIVTLPEALEGKGYSTAAVVNNTFMAPAFQLDQGFDSYDYEGASNVEHRTAVETSELGLTWLQKQTTPTFLFLHYMEPHLNYEATAPHLGHFSKANPAAEAIKLEELVGKANREPPPPDVQEFVRERYDEEILVADDGIKHLVKSLKAQDRWDNTVLVITSDHGEEFWDHGGFEHGHSLMGELTRVPLIVAGGAAPQHGRVDAVVEHVDLVVGLLALAEAPKSADMLGTNIWTIADRTATDHANHALSENILYGPPKVSMVDATARMEFDFESNRGLLWAVDPDGVERRTTPPEQSGVIGRRLSQAIKDVRGSLLPIEGVGGVSIEDKEMFNQLRSLGYIDGPNPSEATTTPSPEESAPSR